jgi:signal peptidase II
VATVAWGGVVAGLVLLVDQLSKRLVLSRTREAQPVAGAGVVRLRPLLNDSGTLGATTAGAVTLWLLVVACIASIALLDGPFGRGASGVGLGAAIGGAIGNSLDRRQRGGVVDFIAISWWPTFNLADAAIVGGIAFALASALL